MTITNDIVIGMTSTLSRYALSNEEYILLYLPNAITRYCSNHVVQGKHNSKFQNKIDK